MKRTPPIDSFSRRGGFMLVPDMTLPNIAGATSRLVLQLGRACQNC